MSKTVVLQVGKYYYPFQGGIERCIQTLTDELGRDFEFKALVSNVRAATAIEHLGNCQVIRMPRFGVLLSQPLNPAIFYWLFKIKADIIHLHLPNPLAVVALWLVRPKGKLVVSYHADIIGKGLIASLINPFLNVVLKKARYIVVTSQNLIELSKTLRKYRNKCVVIPHGIDPGRFELTEDVKEISVKIRQEAAKPIVLFIGRLVKYKGLEILIRAIQGLDIKLIIVGSGGLERYLKKLAAKLGQGPKITWVGNVPDENLAAYYYSCDIFVLPSYLNSETFGISLLEAQLCAKPVISFGLPTGVALINLNDITGITVNPVGIDPLRQAILKLLGSPELRDKFGKCGRERAMRDFTSSSMGQSFLRLYTAIIKQ